MKNTLIIAGVGVIFIGVLVTMYSAHTTNIRNEDAGTIITNTSPAASEILDQTPPLTILIPSEKNEIHDDSYDYSSSSKAHMERIQALMLKCPNLADSGGSDYIFKQELILPPLAPYTNSEGRFSVSIPDKMLILEQNTEGITLIKLSSFEDNLRTIEATCKPIREFEKGYRIQYKWFMRAENEQEKEFAYTIKWKDDYIGVYFFPFNRSEPLAYAYLPIIDGYIEIRNESGRAPEGPEIFKMLLEHIKIPSTETSFVAIDRSNFSGDAHRERVRNIMKQCPNLANKDEHYYISEEKLVLSPKDIYTDPKGGFNVGIPNNMVIYSEDDYFGLTLLRTNQFEEILRHMEESCSPVKELQGYSYAFRKTDTFAKDPYSEMVYRITVKGEPINVYFNDSITYAYIPISDGFLEIINPEGYVEPGYGIRGSDVYEMLLRDLTITPQ